MRIRKLSTVARMVLVAAISAFGYLMLRSSIDDGGDTIGFAVIVGFWGSVALAAWIFTGRILRSISPRSARPTDSDPSVEVTPVAATEPTEPGPAAPVPGPVVLAPAIAAPSSTRAGSPLDALVDQGLISADDRDLATAAWGEADETQAESAAKALRRLALLLDSGLIDERECRTRSWFELARSMSGTAD